MNKKLLLIFVLSVMAFTCSVLSVSSCSAKVYSGKLYSGKHATDAAWELNSSTHELKICGTGAVEGWPNNLHKSLKTQKAMRKVTVDKIIFSEGITSLDIESLNGIVGYKNTKHTIEVILPNSLKTIKNFHFQFLNLSITIPKNVKKIKAGAFDFGTTKSHLSVTEENPFFYSEDGVVYTKDGKTLICYSTNKKNKKFVIPDSVTAIAPLAFANTRNYLEKVILPDGLKKLGSGAFFCCEQLKYINLSNKIKITSITDYDTKGKWCGDDMMARDECQNGHYDKTSKTGINKKQPVTQNMAGIFEGTKLKKITIPDSVKYLSSNTFFLNAPHAYTGLKEIKFGKNFSGKINLGASQDGRKTLTLNTTEYNQLKVHMPKENKYYCMEDGILYTKDKSVLCLVTADCKSEEPDIPDSVRIIGNGAFAGNQIVRTINITGDLDSIGYNAFVDSGIRTFNCTGNIGKIGRNAFVDSEIQSFNCNGSIGNIGKEAFTGFSHSEFPVSNIQSFNCSGSIGNMGQSVFYECTNLTKISIGEIQVIPDYTFHSCSNLESADFGENVKEIGKAAFYQCQKLQKAGFGEKVEKIGEHAFDGCEKIRPSTTDAVSFREADTAASQAPAPAAKTASKKSIFQSVLQWIKDKLAWLF